jgi:hypothetical protein
MVAFEVRPAQAGDAGAMAGLFAAVAEERTGIATEPPPTSVSGLRCSRAAPADRWWRWLMAS